MNHLIFNDEEINKVTLFEYYYHLLYFYISLILLLVQYKFRSIKENSITFSNLLKFGGPLFVKIGQNIANKRNVNVILKKELLKLQSNNFTDKINTPEFISKNYIIDSLDKEPIASGSIASIYKIKYQSKDCVIKILHKNIRKDIIKSINLFENIRYFLNYDSLNYFNQIVKLEQIYLELLKQANLSNEVNNLFEIKNNFKDKSFSDLIIFPDILYHDDQVIIETYLEGHQIVDFIKLYPDRKEEASHLVHCVFYKMFFDNCIHADMHFSNVRFKLDDNKVKIILLDFGLVSKINNIDDYKTFINVYKKNIFSPDILKFKEMIIKFNCNYNADIENFKIEYDQFVNDNNITQSIDEINNGIIKSTNYKNTTEIIKGGLDIASKNKMIFNDYAFNICNGFILLNDYNVEISENNSLMRSRYEYAEKNGFIKDMSESAKILFTKNNKVVSNVEYNEINNNDKIKT